eukprot:c11265_g1_i2.p1 GENE.c11265_g1_i2~~c11265_g1_i2.p1  ORF type:complete len:427 (+),score=61.30 c11265_g1_i2:541-1821(+)
MIVRKSAMIESPKHTPHTTSSVCTMTIREAHLMALLLAAVVGLVSADSKLITVYRITPRNYTGVTNMDTGDSAGDAFFGLYELSYPITCNGPDKSQSISCKNIPILSIPGFNMYSKYTLEVDARFGDYSECNPDPDNGTFICTHFHWREPVCWYDDPDYATAFAKECDPSVCLCDVVERYAVGRENVEFGGPINTSIPLQCARAYEPEPRQLFQGTYESVASDLEVNCCDLCTAKDSCLAYSFVNSTCRLFTDVNGTDYSADDVYSGRKSQYPLLWSQISQLAINLKGLWYSTQEPGRCKPGDKGPGIDCYWRIVENVRNVNSTCVNRHLVEVAVANNLPCFHGCGADAANYSSPCFVECLFDSLSGNWIKGTAALDTQALVTSFERSFDFEDEEDGGCPTIPPCPPPCRPPGQEPLIARTALTPQ